jgi:hypothetical protein
MILSGGSLGFFLKHILLVRNERFHCDIFIRAFNVL